MCAFFSQEILPFYLKYGLMSPKNLLHILMHLYGTFWFHLQLFFPTQQHLEIQFKEIYFKVTTTNFFQIESILYINQPKVLYCKHAIVCDNLFFFPPLIHCFLNNEFWALRQKCFVKQLCFSSRFKSKPKQCKAKNKKHLSMTTFIILNTSITNVFLNSQRELFCKIDVSIVITKLKNICERVYFQ